MVAVEANKPIKTLPTDRTPAVLADENWGLWPRGTPDEINACLKTVGETVRWTMTKEERANKTLRPEPSQMTRPLNCPLSLISQILVSDLPGTIVNCARPFAMPPNREGIVLYVG